MGLNGQKVWTSLAQFADWIFVVARTSKDSKRHSGLSYLLVPMEQPGVSIRPIIQITGGAEFNETFFTDARTPKENIVGQEGEGWKVAMGTLSFERGASTLGQQVSFRQELDELMAEAKSTARWDDPIVRQKLTESYIGLEVLRYNQLRMLTALAADGVPGAEQSIGNCIGHLGTSIRGTLDARKGHRG